jgi:cytochrome c556
MGGTPVPAACDMMCHMSRILILLAISVAALSAQDEKTYQSWMKSTPPQINAIKAAITAKDNAKVKEEADKLASTYQEVADFWMKRSKEDAVKMADATRDAAKAVADATTPEAQTAALGEVTKTCGACHKVYREGSAGNFKIKE